MEKAFNDMLFLPEQASTFAERIDPLHWQIFVVTMLTFFATAAVMLGFYVRYRRKTALQLTEPFHPPRWMEAAFIVAPFVLFMGWFTWGFRDFAWVNNPPKDAMDVYVMGKKWMWKYSYPEGPNMVDTLRVPVGRDVRLLITSRDVLHSFYLPAMRVKKDALPGRYTETWFHATKTGTFPVYCAEYCGLNHSTMIGSIIVMEQPEFENWMQEVRRQSYANRVDGDPSSFEKTATMVAQGQRLSLEKGCARCHTIDGTPHLGPSWQDLYRSERKLQSGETVIADEAYLTKSMMDPAAQKLAGYDTIMPSFAGQLTNAEAGALVEFIKSLRKDRPTTLGAIP